MSRLAAGHPQGPGLDTGEDGATINTGMPKHPTKCNDVPRHLLTVSRDITALTFAGPNLRLTIDQLRLKALRLKPGTPST